MDYDVRDNGDGTYTVSTRDYDSDSGPLQIVFGVIAYLLAVIGMIMATAGVTDIPYAFIILVALDILVIVPVILFPIFKRTGKSMSSFFLTILKFVGRFAYIPFAIIYTVLWILFLSKNTGTVFVTLFFFSMYGMYYFPFFMLKTAYKHDSRILSILTLVAIYSAVTAMTLVALKTQMDGFYPLVFTTTLALFALISVPISNIYYKNHYSRHSAIKISTFFKVIGFSILGIAIILGVISVIMDS